MDYILGVDGGGSTCRAAIATADGRLLGRGKAGPANIYSDPTASLSSILHASKLACEDAGLTLDALHQSFAVLGLAGANAHNDPDGVAQNLPFAAVQVVSDTLIALEGAHGTDDGVIGILGTGSNFMARKDNQHLYLGGWGFHCGDQGSGARMGERALEEALLAHDGLRSLCPLTEHILRQFEDDPRKLSEFARTAKPRDFGEFMPIILIYAKQQSRLALDIVEEGTTYVASALRLLSEEGRLPIALLGGLSHAYDAFLPPDLKKIIIPAKNDALRGALSMAERENAQYS
ncbi:BadF/BadG/BcrA/BcrD ATPase family protein [Pseudovibrio sp. Tun.PSC04-5.I4]|uniref:BadF/BadG/BcrA/BcrD ATPase family protein n=1 Tax=Pseudovibrio sp. Tun.PSC04-5.I4 TaxID=1798213 RepID=UPI00088F7A4D|nr:BadF/BadG/BcrA/BcrD ATPase family protein [Pseudovibrio sp. Tun.PSC04-5.I4]SDR35287.1 glucosamine kinase [Pseudovibrio sp. Tun.PSC04-5.I4]